MTIGLIMLGMLKKESLSAYDIQRLMEYRNISRWMKISTPSICEKVIRLEEKGYITSSVVKKDRVAEKVIYSLTGQGNREFERLMEEIASRPIHIFLDFNAVMINLDSITPGEQKACLEKTEDNIKVLKTYSEENISMKEGEPEIPRTGMAILEQQQVLAFTVEDWIRKIRRDLFDTR